MLTGQSHASSAHSDPNPGEQEEDIYVDPNVRKTSLIDKLYSKVGKERWLSLIVIHVKFL